jgi:hypothetical protein
VKLTFQITGTFALCLWFVLFFAPVWDYAPGVNASLLAGLTEGGGVALSLITTLVLVGYAVLALVLASRRD